MARFYVDNDVSLRLAELLVSQGHDVVTTRDVQREAAGDHEQFWFAAYNERALITHNWRDFHLLQSAWRAWFLEFTRTPSLPVRIWGVELRARLAAVPVHAGILVLPQGKPVYVLAQHLGDLFAEHTRLENCLCRYHHDRWWVLD